MLFNIPNMVLQHLVIIRINIYAAKCVDFHKCDK